MWGLLAMVGIGALLSVGGISIMTKPVITIAIIALVIVYKHVD